MVLVSMDKVGGNQWLHALNKFIVSIFLLFSVEGKGEDRGSGPMVHLLVKCS